MTIERRNVIFGVMGVIFTFIMLDFWGLYFWSNYWAANLPWLAFSSKSEVIRSIMHWQILLNISTIPAMAGLVMITFSESEW